MNELTIDPAYLRNLIIKVRAIMAKEAADIPDVGGNASDDEIPVTLQEIPGDLSIEELREEFEGLNVDQKNELVALMWLGRGDVEPQEWKNTVDLARQRREVATIDYLLDHPLLADYWALGLERLGHGASVLEKGEY